MKTLQTPHVVGDTGVPCVREDSPAWLRYITAPRVCEEKDVPTYTHRLIYCEVLVIQLEKIIQSNDHSVDFQVHSVFVDEMTMQHTNL
jgi:hypothetical protein